MVKHVVMWRLKELAEGADKATNARRIKRELEALRGRIPGLLSLESESTSSGPARRSM